MVADLDWSHGLGLGRDFLASEMGHPARSLLAQPVLPPLARPGAWRDGVRLAQCSRARRSAIGSLLGPGHSSATGAVAPSATASDSDPRGARGERCRHCWTLDTDQADSWGRAV